MHVLTTDWSTCLALERIVITVITAVIVIAEQVLLKLLLFLHGARLAATKFMMTHLLLSLFAAVVSLCYTYLTSNPNFRFTCISFGASSTALVTFIAGII